MQVKATTSISEVLVHGARAVSLALAVLLLCSGCSVVGIGRREPLVVFRDINCGIPAGSSLEDIVFNAALSLHWRAERRDGGVVRCSLTGPTWTLSVDVHCVGSAYTIVYVDSFGMLYRPEEGTIHPGYNKRVTQLNNAIGRAVMQNSVRGGGPIVHTSPSVAPAQKPYSIESFARESPDGHSYRFSLVLASDVVVDLNVSRRIQTELREAVRADYLGGNGTAPATASALRIEFPEYTVANGKIQGRAVVMTVELIDFAFDSTTHSGRLVVKSDPKQFEVARNWVRNNIASLVKDKDVSLLSRFGVQPRFSIEDERTFADEGRLEVSFRILE